MKLVTDVVDNAVIKRHVSLTKTTVERKRKLKQHLCLDKAYNSKAVKQAVIKRDYVSYIPHKRKRGEKKVDKEKVSIKRYPARRCWAIERTNS